MGISKIDLFKHVEENWRNFQTGQDRPHCYKASTLTVKCLRCATNVDLGNCSNCDGEEFEPGPGNTGPSLYCTRCGMGGSAWRCRNCGTVNPYSETLYQQSGWLW